MCPPHPTQCDIPIEKNVSLKKDQSINLSHINAYQGGETSQWKIIPIQRHFTGLISGIFNTHTYIHIPLKDL